MQTTDGNGQTRDYDVIVPTNYDPSMPLALTFVYHGAGGDPSQSESWGLQDVPGAGSQSIFVFPKGIPFQSYGVGWDDSCGGYDMPLFDHILAYMQSHYCIDSSRVFAAGFSWGCDQVTALDCCRGDRIRAIAANSCTDEYSNPQDFHTYDNLQCPVQPSAAIRFEHDASGGDSGYAAPLFTTTSELFQYFNSCTSGPTPISPSPCVSYGGCAELYIECPYPNLGHTLPGNWANDTWSFFSSFN